MQRDTRQRSAIRRVFTSVERPLTPDEVLEHGQRIVPSLGLATVYRNVKTPRRRGVVGGGGASGRRASVRVGRAPASPPLPLSLLPSGVRRPPVSGCSGRVGARGLRGRRPRADSLRSLRGVPVTGLMRQPASVLRVRQPGSDDSAVRGIDALPARPLWTPGKTPSTVRYGSVAFSPAATGSVGAVARATSSVRSSLCTTPANCCTSAWTVASSSGTSRPRWAATASRNGPPRTPRRRR